jgi:DNA-binding transcriptional MerR regulator
MAARNVYTQEQLDEARRKLENLPDLTPQRITREAALENLKDTILVLAKEKGYTVADIKAALDAMEFRFSEKAISGVINESNGKKKRQPRKAEPAQVKSMAQDDRPAS